MTAPGVDERYPILGMFRHHLKLSLPTSPHLAHLARCLDTLHTYLNRNPEPNPVVIHQRLNAARTCYQALQEARMWGVIEAQQNAFRLMENEIITAFPFNNNG